MKEKYFLSGILAITSLVSYAQVGINTEEPKATFDVKASVDDPQKTDGIIAPRLTGNQLKAKDNLYTSEQTGAIVYATQAASPTTPKTVNVLGAGYYYYDGNAWVTFKGNSSDGVNIYNSNGTLTTERKVNQDGKNLSFTGAGNFGIGTDNPARKLHVAGTGRFSGDNNYLEVVSENVTPPSINVIRNNSNANLTANSNVGFLNFSGRINDNSNTALASIRSTYQGNGSNLNSELRFSVNGSGNTQMIITKDNRLGVNTAIPTNVADINGDLRVRSIPISTNTSDTTLVADANGVISKKKTDTKGIFRGYMNANLSSPVGDVGAIYRVTNLNEIDDPGNDFTPSVGHFVAPESGLYRISMTLTSRKNGEVTAGNFVFGFANSGGWIMRFTVPKLIYDSNTGSETSTSGISNTYIGVANLVGGQTYYFGYSQGLTLLSHPTGGTGTGLGSYFEIQLLKN